MKRLLILVLIGLFALVPVLAQDDEDGGTAGVPIMIEPGEIGVVFDLQDGVLVDPLPPGTQRIDTSRFQVTLYDTQRQNVTPGDGIILARALDGQEVGVDIVLIVSVDPEQINMLHTNWGDRYITDFVSPTARSSARDAVAAFTAEELFGEARMQLVELIQADLTERFAAQGVILHDVLLQSLQFSEALNEAIQQRQIAEQEVEIARLRVDQIRLQAQAEGEALLEAARIQAQILVIEAEARFQALSIVSDLIRDNPLLIQYEFVQALREQANLIAVPASLDFLLDLGDEAEAPDE